MGLKNKIKKTLTAGVTKMDLDTVWHARAHGKLRNMEILASCPRCKEDHLVIYYDCKCGDVFFTHLNNAAPYNKPGKVKVKGSPLFEDQDGNQLFLKPK